jgi:hypothetical protein
MDNFEFALVYTWSNQLNGPVLRSFTVYLNHTDVTERLRPTEWLKLCDKINSALEANKEEIQSECEHAYQSVSN